MSMSRCRCEVEGEGKMMGDELPADREFPAEKEHLEAENFS
jgi:hypothetical protein